MAPFSVRLKDVFETSSDTLLYNDLKIRHRLNGVSIGLFEMADQFSFQGLLITGLAHNADKLNGVSFTMLASIYKHFNGVAIAGIYNGTAKGKGLQIGLINKSNRLRGVQIGLWNKIGKRGLPFINMSFGQQKEP